MTRLLPVPEARSLSIGIEVSLLFPPIVTLASPSDNAISHQQGAGLVDHSDISRERSNDTSQLGVDLLLSFHRRRTSKTLNRFQRLSPMESNLEAITHNIPFAVTRPAETMSSAGRLSVFQIQRRSKGTASKRPAPGSDRKQNQRLPPLELPEVGRVLHFARRRPCDTGYKCLE